jgi:haloalkane dehalogenase
MVKVDPALYPFEPRTLKLSSGPNLSYLDEGSENDICFVMLHGNPTWSFFYRHWVQALKSQYRCVVPDHVGCGFSDKPQDYDYCLKQHVSNALELVNHLNLQKVVLVVHDWGGAIGMGLARYLEDRLMGTIINNTAAFTDSDLPKRIALCKNSIFGEFLNRALNGFAWPATWMAMPKGEKLSPELASAYLAPYDSWHNRVAIDAFVKDIPMSKQHKSYSELKSIENFLPSLKDLPKLIFWGEQDFCFNMHFLDRWKEIWPEAPVQSFPQAGHYLFETCHKEILKSVLQWAEQLQNQSS